MTADAGTPDPWTSDDLKSVLRRVFETQIPNYGDYNLVCATPGTGEDSGYYVVGYRWRPAELVFAPFDAGSLAGLEAPTAVNTTNLSHADELAEDTYEVGTSTGRIFRFAVEPSAALRSPDLNARMLEQEEDWEDFRSFVESYVQLA